MDRKLALFALVSVAVFVAGTAALAYRSSSPGGAVTHVFIVNFSFSPSNVTISVSTTVRWVNMDHVGHTVSFGMHGDETGIESGLLGHMATFSYAFTKPGTYEYHCDPHPYMIGAVVAA